jgi:hypothetical protein
MRDALHPTTIRNAGRGRTMTGGAIGDEGVVRLVGYAFCEFSKGGDGVWWWVKTMRCDLCCRPEETGR